ncbi:hypothetical protein, partial [Mesorhizobium sp. M4B.F.Ca.ET.211.01.1.1]|uniref:hypothetical protein n=1 Tax=Mesorhizobium sp. M4B.F.Ca.ET.211.01.1.1 TaxID=2563954 RepID=UPI001AEE3B52
RRFDDVVGELALGRAQLLAHLFDLGQHHWKTRTMLKNAWTIADSAARYKNYICALGVIPRFGEITARGPPAKAFGPNPNGAAQQET